MVGIPRHPQQILCRLLEVKTHLVWVGDENDQEHQQGEQALFSPSVKDIKIAAQFLLEKMKHNLGIMKFIHHELFNALISVFIRVDQLRYITLVLSECSTKVSSFGSIDVTVP